MNLNRPEFDVALTNLPQRRIANHSRKSMRYGLPEVSPTDKLGQRAVVTL
jgi:hypothetical protein